MQDFTFNVFSVVENLSICDWIVLFKSSVSLELNENWFKCILTRSALSSAVGYVQKVFYILRRLVGWLVGECGSSILLPLKHRYLWHRYLWNAKSVTTCLPLGYYWASVLNLALLLFYAIIAACLTVKTLTADVTLAAKRL